MKTTLWLALLVAAAPGCGDDTASGADGGIDLAMSLDLGPAGGPVSGAQDDHCAGTDDMGITQPTSQAVCKPDLAGSPQDGGDSGPTFGDTMFNSSGNDDDCKYFVSWTSTPIRRGVPVTFTVVAKNNPDGSAVTGAMIRAEVFLDAMTSAQSSGSVGAESPTGTYTISGVIFQKPGMWTVRFHLFEDCLDFDPASPHGHAAFYVNVP
ncbi:MAG TPA: hypothetical protein VFF06_25700 [Polyangia bacterium]|nr:hypothetical protein [Polyangia bacterium]